MHARARLYLALFAVFTFTNCGLRKGDDPREAAAESARPWLALVDEGKFKESWEQSAPLFRDLMSMENWLAALKNSRTPLGALVSRELAATSYQTSAPDGSQGKFYILQYKTSFENKASTRELVTVTLDEDLVWRVAGYQIQ